ncbi:MAG TPA: cytotoxic translational repressor of toxin-antitoxin stability system, toxin of TAS system [Mycobacterium sp.]|nr:cytotoxic translational repressor of toxin-antitoxin stability system, toxin of TAS system [Mycobacterium sp.]
MSAGGVEALWCIPAESEPEAMLLHNHLGGSVAASTAHANHLDLYTRNGDDFTGLEKLVRVVAI